MALFAPARHDPFKLDRRSQRSQHPVDALTRLLDSHRERMGMRTLALSTPEGVVVAGSGAAQDQAAELDAIGELTAGQRAESAGREGARGGAA